MYLIFVSFSQFAFNLILHVWSSPPFIHMCVVLLYATTINDKISICMIKMREAKKKNLIHKYLFILLPTLLVNTAKWCVPSRYYYIYIYE